MLADVGTDVGAGVLNNASASAILGFASDVSVEILTDIISLSHCS